MTEEVKHITDETNEIIITTKAYNVIYSIIELSNKNLLVFQDNSIEVYDINSLKLLSKLHNNSFIDFIPLIDGTFASSSVFKYIKIWDIKRMDCITVVELSNIPIILIQMKKGSLVSGSAEGVITIFNMPQYKTKKKLIAYNNQTIHFLIELIDGRLVSANNKQHIKIWDLDSMQSITSITVDDISLWSMIELNNGTILVGDKGGKIRLYHPYTLNCCKTIDDYIGSVNKFTETRNGKVYGYSSEGNMFLLELNKTASFFRQYIIEECVGINCMIELSDYSIAYSVRNIITIVKFKS